MVSNTQLTSVLEETGTIYNDGKEVTVKFGSSPGFSQNMNTVVLPKNVERYIGATNLSESKRRRVLLDILNYYVERLQSGDEEKTKEMFAEKYDSTAPAVAGFVYRIVEDLWIDNTRTNEYQGLQELRNTRGSIIVESESEEKIKNLNHDLQLVTGLRQLALTGQITGIEQADESVKQFFVWAEEKLVEAQHASETDKRKEIAAEITETLLAVSDDPRSLQYRLGDTSFKLFDYPSLSAEWQEKSNLLESASGTLLGIRDKVNAFRENTPVWQQLAAVAVTLSVFVFGLFPTAIQSIIPNVTTAQNTIIDTLTVIVVIGFIIASMYIAYKLVEKIASQFPETIEKISNTLQKLLPEWLLNFLSLPASAQSSAKRVNNSFWEKTKKRNSPVEQELKKTRFEKRKQEVSERNYSTGMIGRKIGDETDDKNSDENTVISTEGEDENSTENETGGFIGESNEEPEIIDGFELSTRGNYESHAYDTTELQQLKSHRNENLGRSTNSTENVTAEIKDRGLVELLTNMFDTPPELREQTELHGHRLDYRNVAQFFAGDRSLFDELYRNRKYLPGGERIIGVSVDFSGSVDELDTQVAVTAIARAAQLRGDNFTAAGFTTNTGGPIDSRTQLITAPDEQFEMEHTSAVYADGKTPLANGVDSTHRLLGTANAAEKVMFIVTDGRPNRSLRKSNWPSNDVASAQKAIEIAKTNNIAVIGFGVNDVAEDVMKELFGENGYVMTDSDDLAEELLKAYKNTCEGIHHQ